MKRKRLFEKVWVYYLAISLSIILSLMSIVALAMLFSSFNFSYVKLIVVVFAVIINLFAFVCLIEKYNNAVLYLNISLGLFIILCGFDNVLSFSSDAFSLENNSLKFLILFVSLYIVINRYKIKDNIEDTNINEIGKE